jgi:hypothetical protein
MIKIRPALVFVLAFASFSHPALAQQVQTVAFQKGDDAVTLEGSITGHDYIDYRISAKSGQTLEINILGTSTVFFNVLPPGDEVAIHNSSFDFEMSNSVKLPRDGTYIVRTYLQGEDESDEKTVRYMIKISIPSKSNN